MPRSFFRNNLKDGGKKLAAASGVQADADALLMEVMRDVSKKKNAASAPQRASDAVPASTENIIKSINGNTQRAPVRAGSSQGENAPSCVVAHAGIYYDDVQVCRALGIHRRVIEKARTKKTRGTDWDCVGLHAGMSQEWVRHQLNASGKSVAEIAKMIPIAEDDGVVSVRLLGVWQNLQRVTVEVVADGSRETALVQDSSYMHLGEIFDCRRYGSSLYRLAELNACTY